MGAETNDESPIRDAAIHLTPLVALGVSIAIAGRPLLWLVVVLPFGPLLLGRLLAGDRLSGRRHRAVTIDAAVWASGAGLGLWALLWVGLNTGGILLMFVALGTIGVLLLAVNIVFLHLVAANDARKGSEVTYPWIRPVPAWLRGSTPPGESVH